MKRFLIYFGLLGGLFLQVVSAQSPSFLNDLKGVMLNLDLEHVRDGLIPSKSFYPLSVPLDTLKIQPVDGRPVLVFKEHQGLDVPPSSLLDPGGKEWVVTVRFFAQTDGVILQHANEHVGYTLRIEDGAVEVILHSDGEDVFLRESADRGITSCLKKWMILEIHIQPDQAMLVLNRAHVARVPLKRSLFGTDFHLRLGQPKIFAPLREDQPEYPRGFSGGLSTLKFLRQ